MKAEYIDHMGSDARVVDAARVSFDKEAGNYTAEHNERLLAYLARHNHWTPFSHPQITLRETVPIFVARQRLKHQIGFTYNEASRRYVDDDPDFFVPAVWRSRPEGSVKQGSGGAHLSSKSWSAHYAALVEHAKSSYEAMIADGIAPEQARMILPQSMMTSYYVTGSLAAWARAYRQRIDAHAQVEIQQLAKQWDEIIAPLFPASWAALTNSIEENA